MLSEIDVYSFKFSSTQHLNIYPSLTGVGSASSESEAYELIFVTYLSLKPFAFASTEKSVLAGQFESSISHLYKQKK